MGKIKHRMSRTPIYRIWVAMIQRCENPNDKAYKDYGGRGIKVCERWRKFENFYADMGNRPEDKSLDRWPDNDGDYEPDNCKWSTYLEQAQNKRPMSCGNAKRRWFFAYDSNTGNWFEDNNQSQFAKEHGLSKSRISECLHKKHEISKGWTFDFLT